MPLRITRALLIFIAVIVVSLLYFFYPASTNHFYPGCALYEFTGLYCPACGSQRAFSELLHGHFLLAMRDNFLFVATVLFLIVFFFKNIGIIISGRRINTQIKPVFLWLVLSLVIAFAILRNIPYKPFIHLAPTAF
jgi:hypothetical protein